MIRAFIIVIFFFIFLFSFFSLDVNDNLNQGMNVNIVNYGPLVEIFEFIRNPLLPIDQLGGKQQNPIANRQNPNADEL